MDVIELSNCLLDDSQIEPVIVHHMTDKVLSGMQNYQYP
jgi:hypothetical protein